MNDQPCLWDIYNHRGSHVGIVQAENMAEALQRADERWPGDGGHVCVGRKPRRRGRKVQAEMPTEIQTPT